MLLIVLNLGTRYDICECKSLWDMTITSFFITSDLHLWPSASVKVFFTLIIWCNLCYWHIGIPSLKFVGSIEFEIWTIIWRKLKWSHNDIIICSILMKSKHKSSRGIPTYQILFWSNVIELRYKVGKVTENYEKNGYCVTVTMTFDPMAEVTNFNRVRARAVCNHFVKTASKSVHLFGFVH